MRGSKCARGSWGRWSLAVTLVLAWTLVSGAARAQAPLPVTDLPPELRPWVPWVLDGLGDRRCPKIAEQRVCFWPGALELDVDDTGATFRLRLTVDHDSSVPLPGSAEHWPEEVRVGAEAAVVLGAATPSVALEPGEHELTGRFVWAETPESLPIPEAIGLITLRVRGQDVPQPQRDKADSVWLGRSETRRGDEPERVELEVFRRLTDGVPFRVETRIVLRVSGRARELALGRPLLPGSRPLALEAEIPARLDDTGTLFVQVRAGEHEVLLSALFATPPSRLTRPPRGGLWPEQEIWVFAPAPELRQVQLSGLIGIDPARTNLAGGWRELAAYVAGNDGGLELLTVQRGQPTPPPNTLRLERELWVDVDGQGFTARDRLRGKMNRDWRLDLTTGELGHVRFGRDDQLITVGPAGHRGIEVRTGELDVVAEWRLPVALGAKLPAAGWSDDLEQASIELRLPPGYRFLGAWGVDEASGSWLSRWNLFGLVYVLTVALVTARMTRWYWGVTALVALALCHEYAAAPYLLWGLLLALLSILRVARAGTLHRLLGLAAVAATLVLLGIAVPFLVEQLRAAAFPEMGLATAARRSGALLQASAPEEAVEIAQAARSLEGESEDFLEGGNEVEAEVAKRAKSESLGKLPSGRKAGSGYGRGGLVKQSLQQQLDLNAIVQTGPGIPAWSGAAHRLSWRGPVERDASLRLLVLAPWQNGLLGLLRVAASLGFAFALIMALFRAARRVGVDSAPRRPGSRSVAATVLGAGVLLASLAGSRPALATVPPDATLTELESRLTRRADCGEACLSVTKLSLDVRDTLVTLDVEVHAGEPSAYQLPGPVTSWVPRTVTVDGLPTRAQVLRSDGYLYQRLDAGRHRLVFEGPVGASELTLTLGATPRRVTVAADGWEIDGVRDGRVEGSLHLSRQLAPAGAAAAPELTRDRAELPPWLEIHRQFEIGVTWKVRTTVSRVSRADAPLAIRFPLLPGEEVTESTLVAEKGAVLLSLGRDQSVLEFTSLLRPVARLALSAATDQPWSEMWTLECGAVWHCTFEGIAPERHEANGAYQPRFRPWPGEQVTFGFARPAAAPGVSTTIDSAELGFDAESSLASLSLSVRTSAGGIHEIELPRDAKVLSLAVAGKPQPIQLREGKLGVVLERGQQLVTLSFRHSVASGLWLSAPGVRVGPAVNATTRIKIPEGRFPVFTSGPGQGTAVLHWGAMALLVAAALALSLLPYHPLARWEWALLALGFPLVPWPLLLPVAGWFFLIGWRESFGVPTWRKNLAQLLIVGTTLAAAGVVLGALHLGLVASPRVLVSGIDANPRSVVFYVDRLVAGSSLPTPRVLTAPDWVWRAVHLVWAGWLAALLWRVGRRAWQAFCRDGILGPWWPTRGENAGADAGARVTVPGMSFEGAEEEDTVRVVADELEGAPDAQRPRAEAPDTPAAERERDPQRDS